MGSHSPLSTASYFLFYQAKITCIERITFLLLAERSLWLNKSISLEPVLLSLDIVTLFLEILNTFKEFEKLVYSSFKMEIAN